MPFLQLTIDLTGLDAETVEAACFEAGALSVTLSDGEDQPILEPALGTTPLWSRTLLKALFAEDMPADELHRLFPSGRLERVEDRIWEREWLKDFHPMRFGQRLWVCPHGQTAPDPGAVVVYLDPGLAFGTGTHPTTAMCLEWLDSQPLADKTIVDYGCGSGILAVAALKLGAREATGVDIDPQALMATRDNAERNGVSDRIAVAFPEDSCPMADIVLANILATPLIELASQIQALVKPDGRIALSGILAEQAQAVTEAYSPWFDMARFKQAVTGERPQEQERAARDNWVCLHGVRR